MSVSASYLLPAVTPPAVVDTPGPGLVYQPDHAGEASALLLRQFDDATRLHAWVEALIRPVQELEQYAFDLIGAFDLATAIGAQLDVLGQFVGVQREGRSDTAYRGYIRARIWGNASDGTPEGVYGVIRAMLGAGAQSLRIVPGWTEQIPAHYNIEIGRSLLRFPWDPTGIEPPERVAIALADAAFLATSAGISLTLFYQYTDDAHTFRFSPVVDPTVPSVGGFSDGEIVSATQGLADDIDEGPLGGALIGAEDRY